jgi:glucokinase
MPHVIAVDLGGTKLSAAVVDEQGRILFRSKIESGAGNFAASVGRITGAIREAETASASPISGVGMVVPGIAFPETGEAWAPNLWGHERMPLRAELERSLRRPVTVDSDRAGYVLGEAWLGAAQGLRDVVFLSVGTGIGAGIISGGRLLRGASGIAGAVGWFALNPVRQPAYATNGCWETEAAGPGLARRLGVRTAEEAVAAARCGSAEALRAVEQTARCLGLGMANLVSVLNPQMIVLGGGLMQAAELFLEPAVRTMREWAQPVAAAEVRVEVTRLGEDAGLLGAARIAFDSVSQGKE